MNDWTDIDYGPLTDLLGVWKGDKGLDVSPGLDGAVNSPYYETITFKAIGTVSNAKSQVLSAVRYLQVVQRKSDNEIFHDETGYWMWDPKNKIVMHSLVIPRAVCVLAGGEYTGAKDKAGNVMIGVTANINDKNWNIIQSPFMQENAQTTEFRQKLSVGNGKLSYTESMIVEIYGDVFEHTDRNNLILQ